MQQTLSLWTTYPLTLASTLYVYPSITGDMSLSEKSYTFMVNKSTLESTNIPIKTYLQEFRDKMVATSIINILQARYKLHSLKFICQVGHFETFFYHGLNGHTIANLQMLNGDLSPSMNMTNANHLQAFAMSNSPWTIHSQTLAAQMDRPIHLQAKYFSLWRIGQ